MAVMVFATIVLLLCTQHCRSQVKFDNAADKEWIPSPAAGCSETYTTAYGEIHHPAIYERYYESNALCAWIIKSSTPLYFYFSEFITETNHDNVFARNGGSIGSPLIGKFSGKSVNGTFTTKGDAYIQFQSDSNVVGAGFVLHWKPYSAEEQCKEAGGFCVESGDRCSYTIKIIHNSCSDHCVCCLSGKEIESGAVLPSTFNLRQIVKRSVEEKFFGGEMDNFEEKSTMKFKSDCSFKCCDCDGEMVTGQCLKFSTVKLSWHDAKEYCLLQKNSKLVSLVDPEAFKKYANSVYGGDRFWLGGSDESTEGEWVWLNGHHFGDQFPWPKHPYVQPDNGGGKQHCLTFGWKGAFDDARCNQKHRFVCEQTSNSEQHGLHQVNLDRSGGIAKASSSHGSGSYPPLNSFGQSPGFWYSGYPYTVPQTLWFEFPEPIRVGMYSFTSRTDDDRYIVSDGPSKYLFWASNDEDCTDESQWDILKEDYSGKPFRTINRPKQISIEHRNFYRCYGFKVIDVPGRGGFKHVTIANVYFYSC